ncbi:hypothetical protein OG497_37920 [Streptomyces sp. NBC_01242]|uniref:hypothetical protein n=1 Tax=Streptomyces sp. NBC_01242 TaxID=2903795 RepID=UPI002258BFC8|nr:hypothetical protein [Streptomyces sp. NBC_01242]MCX4799637.1 hypothetical protein [Streptomyces sp. NBC_01242]
MNDQHPATETPKKIRLQSVGWAPADEVGNLEVGDRIMWNGGNTSEVTAIEQVSRCFRLISLKSTETGEKETPRRLKNTAIVARIPQVKEEAPAAVRTLPTLEGHTVRATLKGTMWTVALYVDGNAEPLFTDKIGDHVPNGPGSAANVLIFAREQQLKEAAALAALDDTTAYVALRSDAVEAEPVTAEGAREILRQARREAGPEPVRSYGAPRMTLTHSGAFWRAVVTGGRSVAVTPAVVHGAGCAISKGTGDGMVYPVEKPGIRTCGPWVRPVPGRADCVIVSRVANGFHQRPEREPVATRWDEYMQAYQNALEAAGWTLEGHTDDGDVYRQPADQH